MDVFHWFSMLDVTDIRLSIKSVAGTQVDPFEWAKQILPNNILTDASRSNSKGDYGISFRMGFVLNAAR